MSRSSERRGTIEPLAALAAVFAVCAAIGLYAVALGGVVTTPDRNVAEPTLTAVHDELNRGGVAYPARLSRVHRATPRGHRLNVTLVAGGEQWAFGPTAPSPASTADRPVSVRLGPGRIKPGRLVVEVWT